MRAVKIVIGTGLALAAALLGIVLSHSPISVARNSVLTPSPLTTLRAKTQACQANETLPRGTSAIRMRVFSAVGPRVTINVFERGKVIAAGEHGSGWTGGVVTLPVHPLATTRSDVKICFKIFLNGNEGAYLAGESARRVTGPGGRPEEVSPRLGIEYLRPARSSWWSIVPEVARRMGLGRAWSGTWVAVFVLALMLGVTLLASRLVIRELR